MITKLSISNYRSIGEGFELELGRLTALVGANGSGKSNIADALRFIAECMLTQVSTVLAVRGGIGEVLNTGADPARGLQLRVEVRNDLGEGYWSMTLVPESAASGFHVEREEGAWRPMPEEWQRENRKRIDSLQGDLTLDVFERIRARSGGDQFRFVRAREGWEGPPGYVPMALSSNSLALPSYGNHGVLNHLANELRQMAVYAPFPNTLRPPQRPNPTEPMQWGGENWTSTLAALDRKTWGAELVTALNRLVGDIDDYEVKDLGGYLLARFRHPRIGPGGQPRWLAAAQESDGTLRVAAILTALFQQPAPALLGFEEPELAIHPGAIPVLYDFLNEATVRSQILLTTHSPDLLDLLDIDDVRVVGRHGGATTVARVEERQRGVVKNHLLSTSDLVHAEGLLPEGGWGDA